MEKKNSVNISSDKQTKSFKRETKSLLMAAQNNAIRTYYVHIYQPLRSGRIWH